MTIYALLKNTTDGRPSAFHGMTTSRDAADTWESGCIDNWVSEFECADDYSINEVSFEAYVQEVE